ncbi:NACHT domain-containing protein [Actinophytocola oryzae]|uniref:NACHT domain-containing protein n=1 Tax=Actinophytocola oryzae TaxID=502181 RepID=UPI00106374EE|nr:NACHT domain-containing protein [Actinophytocola oryzae]
MVVAFVGLLFVVVAIMMVGHGAEHNDVLASVVSAFVGLGALIVALVALLPPKRSTRSAEELAADLTNTVLAEWWEEAGSRKLRDPRVLPLTWSTGRMDGRFDEASRRLAETYREIRSGRLVMLGEPGSGKTVLAMMLAIGLASDRTEGGQVPVLLSASSWDPVREPLDDWLVHTLAGAYYNGRTDTPRMLLNRGLVLPILDGLDEIPEVARLHAIHRINAAVGAERPIVVTCRAVEYDDLIEAGSPALRHAPVQRIAPIGVGDVVVHLAAVPDWPPATSWTTVFDSLRGAPDGPVAAALSTPLMISLAVAGYRHGGDPAELVDPQRFPSRHSVENHLLDRTIDTAFAPDLQRGGTSRWSSDEGRQWLTFLARHLHDHRERDLAWWLLADRLLSAWVAPILGIAAGAVVGLAIGVVSAVTGMTEPGQSSSIGITAGVLLAVLTTMLWYCSSGRTPGRVGFVRDGSLDRLRRGFRTGAALVSLVGVPVLIIVVTVFLIEDVAFSTVQAFGTGVGIGVTVLCVVGCAVAAHHWLDAIPDHADKATPLDFVRRDRTASIVGAAVAGLVAAALVWPFLVTMLFLGNVLSQGVAGSYGLVGVAEFPSPAEELDIDGVWPMIGTVAVVPFLSVASLTLSTRAWPRFVVARVVLAATGRLPWRLLAFLADSRKLGLLRQSGGTYQFRHVRLQQRLALPSEDESDPHSGPTRHPTRRRRVVAAAAVMALAATGVVTLVTYNHLRCAPAFSTGSEVDQRRVSGGVDECVGVVPETVLNGMAATYPEIGLLLKENRAARTSAEHQTVAVFLRLGTAPSERTRSIIVGTALAQHESALRGHPTVAMVVETADAHRSVALGLQADFSSRTRTPVRARVMYPEPDTDVSLMVHNDLPFDAYVYGRSPQTPVVLEHMLSVATSSGTPWSEIRDDAPTYDDCSYSGLDVGPNFSEMPPDRSEWVVYHSNCLPDLTGFVTERALADYLKKQPGIPYQTFYYPGADTSPARAYADVVRGSDLRVATDRVAENAYQLMVHATGTPTYKIEKWTASDR